MKKTAPFFFLFLLTISACASNLDLPAPEVAETSYPAATASVIVENSTSYPAATEELKPVETPVQSEQLGSLRVVVFHQGSPFPKGNFFLANILKSSEGQEIAVSLDREVAPRALSTETGLVEFYNVNPGRYGFVYYDGFNIYMLLNPKDGKGILVDVVAGETLDLGTFDFNELPID